MNENPLNQCNHSENSVFKKDAHFSFYSGLKRCFDFTASFIALVLGAIPMLIIALAVRLSDNGPAIFRQKRIGKDGKPFSCLKFRSMSLSAPASCATANLDQNAGYITPIGKLLRKTSLDELPQIINILKGEMSFIGPRPLIPEEEYIHNERLRLGVYNLRPGISGLAQVNGRDFVKPDEKVRLDAEYLNSFGMVSDLKILFKTFFNVLGKKDIHEGSFENDRNTPEDGSEAENKAKE